MFPQVSYVIHTSEFTSPQILPVLSYFQAFTQGGTEKKNILILESRANLGPPLTSWEIT